MDWLKKQPLSLKLLLAVGVVIILQLLPIPGIFLMMLGAPFWSVFLINGGAIAAGFEAATGRISRWFLLVPFLWFGGYAAFYASDRLMLADLRRDFAASNASVRIPFDPQTQALATTGNRWVERQIEGLEGMVEGDSWDTRLIENYNLPVHYRDVGKGEPMEGLRTIGRDMCEKLVADGKLQRVGGVDIRFDQYRQGRQRYDSQTPLCSLRVPEAPGLPLVTVKISDRKSRKRTLPVQLRTTTVTTPDGRSHVLQGGTASPLGPLPMPVIGCFLSGDSGWKCQAKFIRDRPVDLLTVGPPYGRDDAVLAVALGLKPVTQAGRIVTDPALAESLVAAARSRAVERATADLERLLTGEGQVSVNDLVSFRLDSQRLVPYAPRIIEALETQVETSELFNGRGNALALLVVTLPDQEFIAYGPRILALYPRAARASLSDHPRSNGNLHWLYGTEMYERLAILGPSALPVLTEALREKRDLRNVLTSLCVIGRPAASATGAALVALNNDDNFDGSLRKLLYVTLLRLGLRDQIVPQDRDRAWFGTARNLVTPATPPEICSDYGRMLPEEEIRRRKP
jgi:hypothetical protein